MTYVSRKTRIIVSRWADECDAEYTVWACRKRSDGRLKKYSSCEDLRAWGRDDCLKNEHLVELMSNGEFLGKPPFRLYGRFIPVPILFKLTQDSKTQNFETKYSGKEEINSGFTETYRKSSVKFGTNSNEDSKLKGDSSLTRIQWEKNLLEKHLVKCTCLLNIAFEKLEKIDVLVGFANEETENARKEEIQEAFYKSKLLCTCSLHRSSSAHSSLNSFPDKLSLSKSSLKKSEESDKCAELLRKISSLREKLRKIKETRKEIRLYIRASQQTGNRCSSSIQVTELYSRREQAETKRLQKKYEKLTTERRRLLSEMCQALTALNALKRSSNFYLDSQRMSARSRKNQGDFRKTELLGFTKCSCGCQCSENYESSSEKLQCSASSSGGIGFYKKPNNFKRAEKNSRFNLKNSSGYLRRMSVEYGNVDLERLSDNNSNFSDCNGNEQTGSKSSNSRWASCLKINKKDRNLAQCNRKKFENNLEQKDTTKTAKKSKLKFICEERPCRKKFYADDLADFESSLTPEQKVAIQKAVQNVKNIQSFRPSTSPTTKREKQTACLESRPICRTPLNELCHQPFGGIPGRRVKSETTMKEIEKTLRNYEQRLCNLDSLECKVEGLKEKSSEACQLRKKLAKVKEEVKRQMGAKKEKYKREITRLCSENWELKKQLLQVTAMFEAQNQKIHNLKCSVLKAKELECEAEELKKELSEYRESLEHQRQCIFKWENEVAMQRTEIENLTNHIRKLTIRRQEPSCNPYQDKRYIQRSRSYSPEKIRNRITTSRPKTQVRNSKVSSEEEEICYCKDYRSQEGRRKNQLRNPDRGYFSQIKEHMEWSKKKKTKK